jgi:hypothetical protein
MFVAREYELDALKSLLACDTSSLAVVYGRRRIGKTQTIREFVKTNNLFHIEVTGVHGASKAMNIKSFARTIDLLWEGKEGETKVPREWQELFFMLEDFIKSRNEPKKVIFLDEFPWLDTKKSYFLEAFSHFWNNFCTKRDDIILIVCGSQATYMIDKFIKNKKTLHARTTLKLGMREFDLSTAKQLLQKKGCNYSNKSIIEIYMAFGGVAKYLDGIDCTKLVSENIGFHCFNTNGLLKTEYKELYSSLFDNAKWHYQVMNLLASKWSGYTQKELALKLNTSASVIKDSLEDLESSGFINSIAKFNQTTRDKIYRASDSFSYFYQKWMSDGKISDWSSVANTQQYAIWAGFSFENICHLHVEKIKHALGISGVPTQTHYWSYIPQDATQQGAQIDLLLEHTNGSKNIDIIECKYYNGEFTIDKSYYNELKRKIAVFDEQTKHRYNIRLIFVTTHGVVKNEYYNEIIQKQLTIDALF